MLNIWRRKTNIVYLMSFDSNVDFIKQLASHMPKGKKLVVYYRRATEAAATDLAAFGITTRPFKDNLRFVFAGIPRIMTAKVIFCDNYYAFIGGLVKGPSTKIVQLWHANGAIKKFGWQDPTTEERSASDKRRFQAVYDKFDDYIVSSESMGRVFSNSYATDMDRMKMLGYPRSDQFFDKDWVTSTRKRIFRSAPELANKRVILYAPTYRDDKAFSLPKGTAKALSSDPNAIVIIKLHPVLRDREGEVRKVRSKQIRFLHEFSTNELLTVCDTLVTDYSSVAFDFSLLDNAKSVIFYMFDLKKYKLDPGIQDDFLDWLPSNPVLSVNELREEISAAKPTNFDEFNRRWNTYNDGHASDRVIDHYLSILES